MPAGVFERCLDRLEEIRWNGVVTYHFLNEPLLDERLEYFIARTKQRLPHSLPRVYSNADALTPTRMKSLIAAGMNNITVTQHPPSSAAWMRNLQELRADFGRWITFRGVIDGANWLTNWSGRVNVPSHRRHRRCIWLANSLTIRATGDVLLCCQTTLGKPIMGNIHNASLMEIWRSEKFARIRKEAISGKVKLDMCARCLGHKRTEPARPAIEQIETVTATADLS
jgi:radical SAM protein with 4Fe4S-binding SPASM domain